MTRIEIITRACRSFCLVLAAQLGVHSSPLLLCCPAGRSQFTPPASYAKAQELAKELNMYFKAPVKVLTLNDIAIKEISMRLSKLESSYSLYNNFLFGMASFFTAAILAQTAAISSQQAKLSALESKSESHEKYVAKVNSKLLKQDYEMKLMGHVQCTYSSCSKECPADAEAATPVPDVPIATEDDISAEGVWSISAWLKWLSGA